MDKEEIKQKIKIYEQKNRLLYQKVRYNESIMIKLRLSLEIEKLKDINLKKAEIAILQVYWEEDFEEPYKITDVDGIEYDSISEYMKKHPEKKFGIVISKRTSPNSGDVENETVEEGLSLHTLVKKIKSI
jgi:hypothetical protein